MKISANSACPCGSKLKFKKCCKIYHNGTLPKTALELMKSRYSAYVVGDSKYIMKTTHQENQDFTKDTNAWSSSIKDFSKNTNFKGLEVLDFIDGQEEAYVTFKAFLEQNTQDASFIEKSKFYKVDGMWLYHSGVIE